MTEIKVTVTKLADRKYYRMAYVDPITEKKVVRSTKKTTRRDAERVSAVWESELREGRFQPDKRITWEQFRERYEKEKLASLADKTQVASNTAFNHLENLINPKRLASLNSITLSRFQAELRKTEIRETSIACHLRHIKSALNWAVSIGLLTKMPKIEMPRRAKGVAMRGRPIVAEEFERMIATVPKVRKRDPGNWQRFLTGLWLSGLRLGEALALSWDEDAPFAMDLSGKHPRFRIWAEAEKGHRDRFLPILCGNT